MKKMRNKLKTTILAALCGSTALSALPPEAFAGPMGVAPPAVVGLNAPTTEVHYYRHYWRHRHYGYWRPYHRHWRHHYWGYYRPYYYRRAYYRYPYYGYGYDPAGAVFASAALGLMGAGIAAATAPRWGWGGGWGGWGGGGWGPGWGWGGGWW